MAKKSNYIVKTEVPQDAPNFSEYSLKSYFEKIGILKPNCQRERLDCEILNKKYSTLEGLVYCFVIDGKILKIGKTDTTMAERVKSYNCGTKAYRERGTCSTTNYNVLQSFLAINKPVEIWAYFVPPIKVEAFGESFEITTSPAKFLEKLFQEKTQAQFGEKLLFCIQN